jgi:hypothetical protein
MVSRMSVAGSTLYGPNSGAFILLEIKWGEASIYCPPGDWFSQHFNTGKEPARHLAVRYGSRLHPLGFKVSHQRTDDDVFRSVEEGVG